MSVKRQGFKKITTRVSRLIKKILGKTFLGNRIWTWSTGNIAEEVVQEYLEHRRNPSNQDNNQMILE